MTPVDIALLSGLVFVGALLYSSVGHGGGSGYLAAMALFGLPPLTMKPTALSLNIFVSGIGTTKFYRAGAFSWRLFWPFALTSVPLAFLGGLVTLPGSVYKIVVGVVLIYAAFHLFEFTRRQIVRQVREPPIGVAFVAGAGLGFLAGLTGVGGGIFLSPLLLLFGWADARHTAGVSAAFILANSISGLAGYMTKAATLPGYMPILVIAAIAGGWIGAEYGSKRFTNLTIRRLLALILVIAGIKMILI